MKIIEYFCVLLALTQHNAMALHHIVNRALHFLYMLINFEVEQVLAVEELLPSKYRWKWRIGSKRVYPNMVDDQKPVFSKYVDSKLRSWMKKLNQMTWGWKDYDTLDSLRRVLNPEKVSY